MILKKLVMVFIILFFVVPNTFALGISPSKSIIFFEPNLSQSFEITVRNSENRDVKSDIYIYGEHGKYTHFENQTVLFSPKESKKFNFDLKLPESFEEPGDYRFDFVATEVDIMENTNFISVLTSVGSVFIIRVPYEGHYLKATLTSKSASTGEIVPFKLVLENLGTLPIDYIEGILEIFDESGNKVDEIPFIESLEIKTIKDVEFKWHSGDNKFGNYNAKITLKFKGKEVLAESDFKLGDVHISIVNYDKEIKAGEIGKFNINVKSEWGNPVEDVFTRLEIGSSPLKAFKSESFNMDPWGENNVIIYVDAEEIEKGTYPAKVSVVYDGIYTEEEFELKVRSPFFSPINGSILIGIAVFIIVLVVGYFMLSKKRKKK
jgi:hypothetical protein